MLKARVDKNQAEIITEFKNLGCSVMVTSNIHKGFPDLTIGIKGLTLIGDITDEVLNYLQEEGLIIVQNATVLIEVKDGDNKKLTEAQVKFHTNWKGNKIIIRSVEEVKELLGK